MKGDSNKVVIVLVVLLLVAVGYIGFEKLTAYDDARTNEQVSQGAQIGATQAILAIAQQAAQCNQVPLIVGNQTINIIAVDCLQGLTQAQAAQ
jgi:hypothetical protein